MSEDLETKAFELCPVKITHARPACMYTAIDYCRCEDCSGLGLYLDTEIVRVCPVYERLCKEYYRNRKPKE